MKLKAKISALLAAVVLGVGLSACSGGEEPANTQTQATENGALARIKAAGKIRIGVFGDKPPFGFVDADGANQGFDVAIAKNLGKALLGSEDKVEFVLTEAANRVEYLKSDKVDLILANFTKTPERAEVVDFAEPYMNVALGVVSSTHSQITDVAELNGLTLIVNKGTTADAFFSKNHPEIKLLKFDHNTEAFAALKDGRGVALAHDNALLWAWARENREFSVGIAKLGPEEYIAPAVRQGELQLLEWVNANIAEQKQNGQLEAAFEKELKPVYGLGVKAEDLLAK